MRQPFGARLPHHCSGRSRPHPHRPLLVRWAALVSGIVLLGACTQAPAGPTASPITTPTTSTTSGVSVGVTAGTDVPRSTGVGPSAPTTTDAGVTTRPTVTGVSTPAPPGRPAIPAVVGLRWLGPDPEPAGPQIEVSQDVRRWQGPVSGEYAVRTADRRRWFGADGSAVTCRGERTCVGFDAAGVVAVLDGSSVRSVYDAAGIPLGLYTPDGRRRPGREQPSIAVALAATGLDLAALVDEAGRRVPFAGGVTGDPHLITGGGRRVSVQYAGDFDARSGDPERRIQVRWARLPHQPDVTITTSIAIATGGTVVQVDGDGRVLIGGAPVLGREQFQQVRITGGPVVGAWPVGDDESSSVVLVWSDGATLTVQTDPDLGVTAILTAPRSSSVRGIFGTGDPTNPDLVDRQGIALDSGSVLADWSVPAGDSLFDVPGPSVIGYPTDVPEVPDQSVPFATRICQARGISAAPDLAACVFDVGLTGDARFAVGHGRLVAAAQVDVPAVLSDRWPAMRDAAPASASQLPALVDVRPGLGQQLVYSLPVTGTGDLTFRFVSGCPDQDGLLAVDRPALRLFDPTGHAVSARIPTCGVSTVDQLAPGRYRLVVAGALIGELRSVRFDVHEG